MVGRNGERMLYTLRVKIFAHLQRLGLDFYEHEMSGRIMTRMTTDVDALDTFLQTGLITMVNAVLTFTGVLVALLFINFRLGVTLLAIIPVLVAATLVFRAKSSGAYADAREKVSMVNADLQENVAGLRTAQAYRRVLFSPVQQLSQVFDGYNQAAVGLRRIKDLLRRTTSTPAAAHPRTAGRPRGRIEFRDVRFRYSGQPQEALSGVNLVVRPGETVALVGQTGAGKSTMVKLVARYYDATSGRLLIDGTDIRELDLSGYRQQLGVVPQEPYLFPGTVRDAIAYGRPDATDADVETAARGVGAIEMIARLPGGFGHEVAERGRNLAAGQRQLIALARAYLVDPAILLLDEATAALDLASEAAVNSATERLTARRTTLVVAHRLTTASRADRIVVMESGRIAETGRHEELLERGGSYAALWAAFAGNAELVA